MLATSISLATAALVASHLVDVHSAGDCPSARDIVERLRPLLPTGSAQVDSPDLATVETAGAELHIRLVRDNGSEVGDRRVTVQDDCAEAATTVAAVIAAWETEPFVQASPGAAAPGMGGSPAPGWQLLLGASGGLGMIGGVAGAGNLEALAGKRSSRLQGRIGMSGETSRTLSLPPGSVAWKHTGFDAGVVLRALNPVWSMSFDAGLVLGWATLEGSGFSQNRKQRSFEYGADAAARLTRRLGRWGVWAEARARGWGNGQRASHGGATTGGKDLPVADVAISVGVSAPPL